MNRIIIILLVSLPALAEELSFKKQPDSFFEPVAEYVDKDKGLIYVQKMWESRGHDKVYYKTAIDFYDNRELKGEAIAKFRTNFNPGSHSLHIRNKPICVDNSVDPTMVANYDNDAYEKYRVNFKEPYVYCVTDFYLFQVQRAMMQGPVKNFIFYNVTIEDKEKGVFSTIHEGKKIYAKYAYLDKDYVPSINERRKEFESCLNEALEKGLKENILKSQECLKNNLSLGWPKVYDTCSEAGFKYTTNIQFDEQKDAIPDIKEPLAGVKYTKEEYVNLVLIKGIEEFVNKNFIKELTPVSCEKDKWYHSVKVSYGTTIFNECSHLKFVLKNIPVPKGSPAHISSKLTTCSGGI